MQITKKNDLSDEIQENVAFSYTEKWRFFHIGHFGLVLCLNLVQILQAPSFSK